MSKIPVDLRFRFHDKLSLDGDISDHSQIQYFEFEEWNEHPPRKFLNVGSKFKFDGHTYEIVRILTNLDVLPYENVPDAEIGSQSELTVYYEIKEV